MQVLVFVVALFGIAYSDDVCEGKADGYVPNYGCVGYTECVGGVSQSRDCNPLRFNPATQKCDNRENIDGPCGADVDCTGKADGLHRVEPYCDAYYTCINGVNRGINMCYTGLVFNDKIGQCDWPYNTAPPCGTLTS